MFFYGLIPIATFAISAVVGAMNLFGKWKWITPVKLGIMYLLIDYCTFRLANNIAFDKLNSPEWILLAVGAVISLVGMLAGITVRKMKERKK